MEKLVRPALRAIPEAIDGIEDATRGKTIGEFRVDWLLRHGVQRGIEIISEAARRIPQELRDSTPNLPWAQIMGIGNVLRHEYHRISDQVIWNVIGEHLPNLRSAVLHIEKNLLEKRSERNSVPAPMFPTARGMLVQEPYSGEHF